MIHIHSATKFLILFLSPIVKAIMLTSNTLIPNPFPGPDVAYRHPQIRQPLHLKSAYELQIPQLRAAVLAVKSSLEAAIRVPVEALEGVIKPTQEQAEACNT